MCKVSDKLKLCTCASDAYSLKHYWVLHRFINGKNDYVLGEAIMPKIIDEETERYNWSLLEKLLNDGNVFDVEMNPKENDRLELSFTVEVGEPGSVQYGFTFRNKIWVRENYDVFEWMQNHEEDLQGKIKDAMQK